MTLIECEIELALEVSVPVAVPCGSQVLSVVGNLARVSTRYDYDPFDDRDAPAFEFLADELVIDASGDYTITRDVVYLSLPGRTTVKKESSNGS